MLHLGGNPLIRTIRIRPPSVKCVACGPDASVNVEEYDYATFCSGPAGAVDEEGLGSGTVGERISVQVSSSLNLSWRDHSDQSGVEGSDYKRKEYSDRYET